MSGTWPSPSVAVRFTPVALHVCFFPMRAPFASVSESKSNRRGLAVKLRARSPSARVGAASRDAGFLLFERARSVLGEGGGNPGNLYRFKVCGSQIQNFWKRTGKHRQKKSHTPVYVGSSSVAMYAFGFQECTTKLFGSPDSDASPHLSLALAFPLPASADRRPLRSPTRGVG